MSTTDTDTEMDFGAGTDKPKVKRIANLKEIIHSDEITKDSPELVDGSVIEGRFIPAIDLVDVLTAYPVQTPNLTPKEKKLVSIAEKKRKGMDNDEWFNSLTDVELAAVTKASGEDKLKYERAALQLHYIAVNPKMTQEDAIGVLKSFRSVGKMNNFLNWITDMSVIRDGELKNS